MGVKLQSSSGGSVEIAAPVTASNYTLTAPAVSGAMVASTGTPADNAIVRFDGTSGAVQGSSVYIDDSGNLGIGTTAPSAKLHVVNSGYTSQLITNSANGVTVAMASNVAAAEVGTTTNHPYVFVTNSTERARIGTSGNLLINSASDVDASAFLSIRGSGTKYPAALSAAVVTSAYQATFWNPNGLVGSITSTGSSTAYVTSSDYRLKDNVAPMEGALEKIAALKPCTFTWVIDGSVDRGFIAHELQEVIPQAVSGEKDAVDDKGNIRPQGVDYGKITPELVAAIQELYIIVDGLRTEIAEIKGRIA